MSSFFVIVGTDRPGMEKVRASTRPAHREHLRHPGKHPVRVRLGGPLLAEDGRTMNGTLLVVEAESEADVERFLSDDPYVRQGVFASIEIRRWRWGLGNPDARA